MRSFFDNGLSYVKMLWSSTHRKRSVDIQTHTVCVRKREIGVFMREACSRSVEITVSVNNGDCSVYQYFSNFSNSCCRHWLSSSILSLFLLHVWRSETTERHIRSLQLFLSLATVVDSASLASSVFSVVAESSPRLVSIVCFLCRVIDLQKCAYRSYVLWSRGRNTAVSAFWYSGYQFFSALISFNTYSLVLWSLQLIRSINL